ncbi:host cell division inhibitor Icd-like protein [Serratia fonticola]
MMALNYGVGAEHTAPHKGYSDFVQHTGPMLSGQLGVSLSDAQTLPVTFGYSQAWYNSFGVEQTLCADFIGMQIGRNSLMGLNSGESPESAKHEQYSGSEAPTKFVATCTLGMRNISHTPNQQIAGKEKGSTANATLWVNADGDQSFSCLAFLRCSALSLRPQASSTQVEKFTLEPSSFSRSTLASISAVSSCGKRIPLYMVLLFMWFFAMLSLIECLNKDKITAKNGTRELFKQNALTCLNILSNLFKQSDSIRMKIAKPSSVSSTDRASNHNVIGANTMACQHSTQTRPKFVFLFLGTPNEFPNTTPTVLRVEADTEDEGRAKFVGWTLIFAAQIRTEAPCRLQLFSTDEGFMWVYEQRQSATEVRHA